MDTLSTVRHLKELGVSVYSEKENINTLDDSTEMILTILSSQAQEAGPVASVRGVTTAVTGAGSMSVVSPLSS